MNLVVVEDSPAMLRLLLAMLARVQGLHVVGTAGSEREAIALIARTRPDVVLLDLFLTPGHGLEVLRAIRAAGHTCQALVLTSETVHHEYRRVGERLGVVSFHDKGDGLRRLMHDLERAVAAA